MSQKIWQQFDMVNQPDRKTVWMFAEVLFENWFWLFCRMYPVFVYYGDKRIINATLEDDKITIMYFDREQDIIDLGETIKLVIKNEK